MNSRGKRNYSICLLAFALIVFSLSIFSNRCHSDTIGSNLLKNASFEETKDADQYGNAFAWWSGWIFENPARFAVGTIAHSGERSAELIADKGGKIRLMSPKVALQPGRYRVQMYLRGLSVGPGAWKNPLDVSFGFDGKYHVLQKTGTFGWTKVHHVFELGHSVDNFQLIVGLFGGGWLWIDDVSLEKVGTDVELTKLPIIGGEELAFADPRDFPADGPHCTECGCRLSREKERCSACGHPSSEAAHGSLPQVRTIADFEDGKKGLLSGGTITSANPPQGRYALAIKDLVSITKPQDWSGFDQFRFDVYNPSEAPVPIYLEIRDKQTKSYWTRVNYDTVVPPGNSTVTIPTSIYVGEKSRPGRALLKDSITHLFINPKGMSLVIDNLRLERLDTADYLFKGLHAFDFGPIDSPVMAGFQQVTAAMAYEPNRGFGWEKADIWRSFNALQPDPLYQDFICPRSGSFRVDLPNGSYHVVMNIDSPGGYWGEPQVFEHRRVFANGVRVVDEAMDISSFKRKYFRNAQRDDVPGMDPFTAYVQPMFNLKEFDVKVSDGKLDVKFEGDGFAISLSSLVCYPIEKSAEGKRFWSWVTGLRRAQFNDYFKQVVPKKVGLPASAGGYRLFTRNIMSPVNAFDGPLPHESIPPEGLAIAVAKGEEGLLPFSLQPSGDPGEITLEIGELAYTGPHDKPVSLLPASVVKPGWLDYRISRVTMEGSVYTVAPRYWHPVPAPAAPGVTRTFWLRVKTPTGAQPGPYRSVVTVRPRKGIARTFPLTITVLPFTLDKIDDVAVGPWGSSISLPWSSKDPKTAQWNWTMFEKSLELLKEAGCTSFSGLPHLKVTGKNGKLNLDTALADKEMALVRSKGFTRLISSYGVALDGYQQKGNNKGPDQDAAKKYGFPDAESFLKELYRLIDEHAVQNDWLPVAWNIFDEPIGEAIKGATVNALAHRRAAEGLRLTTFMGATSLQGNNPRDPHYELVRAVLMPSFNIYDEGSLKVVHDAGNKLSYYNNGNRWTFGRYLKMMVLKHDLALRLTWHYNVVAGDPYYALDCREDDYCWYNTDAYGIMVPSVALLGQIIPGLNDYRYLTTLQRLIRENPRHPGLPSARKVFDSMISLVAGKDQQEPLDVKQYEKDRTEVVKAILTLISPM